MEIMGQLTNEEAKASLNKFLKEREERIKNMSLAEARDIVSRIYGHSDMRMESDKALQMLLDCADKALEQELILEKDGTLIITTEHYENVGRVLVQYGTSGTLFYQDYEPCEEREQGKCPFYAS